MSLINELKELYAKNSKHSNYQILPNLLLNILSNDNIEVRSRFEKERMDYFKDKINFTDKSVIDIGGNSGYFSFETLDAGAKSVHHFEGHKEHSEFVALAAKAIELESKVEVTNDYFLFDEKHTSRKYDIVLLLNVLHHLGDDYGDNSLNIEKAKEGIINQLNNMSYCTDHIIFQMGYCWQGNTSKLLFENGTKSEMIDFVTSGIEDNWVVEHIGIAESIENVITYKPPNEDNLKRDDSLGEFLNRPIFILKSNRV